MSRRKGFTLVEVMVAVAVGAVVILAAHGIFAGVTGGARALLAARETLDREANARRWLKASFLSLDPPFEGKPDRVRFTAWQLSAGGWFEPQRIDLGREAFRLAADSVTSLAFDYLLDPGANSKWVREWISPVSAPLAIRIRLRRGIGDRGRVDTLLFLIKERG